MNVIRATGSVLFASSMGVATADAIVSTSFDVPANIELGDSDLVVANGIPSVSVTITISAPLNAWTISK